MITENKIENIKIKPLNKTTARRGIKIFSVVKEHHIKGKTSWLPHWDSCKCSYCFGSDKLHYGLNIPKNWKAANSWWVIKYGKAKYFRWTNSWLNYFA